MPPQSLSILLCVVATFGVALEELNWEPCIPEDTRYHEYSFLKITFMSCLQMTKIRHLKSPQGNSVAFHYFDLRLRYVYILVLYCAGHACSTIIRFCFGHICSDALGVFI